MNCDGNLYYYWPLGKGMGKQYAHKRYPHTTAALVRYSNTSSYTLLTRDKRSTLVRHIQHDYMTTTVSLCLPTATFLSPPILGA